MASSSKRPWAAPLRELRIGISSRGGDRTGWTATWRTAQKGDEKDVSAVLAAGEWPKDIATKEDAVRALGAVVTQLWDTFLSEK